MKFLKGAIMGSMATAAAMVMYRDMSRNTKSKMIRKGKQFARKMGMM